MNPRALTLCILLPAASACGGAQTQRASAAPVVPPRTAAGGDVSSLLRDRFADLARSLEPRGVHFGGVVGAGFITFRSNVVTPIDLPAHGCVSVVALTSQGIRDLDAHVFSAEGELLVEDTQPDPHPTVQLCSQEARRVYHVIETFDQDGGDGRNAQGAYAIGAFVSDRPGLAAVARVMGGRPGTALAAGEGTTDAERRLSELRDGIARRGFTPSGEVLRAPFAAAGALRFPIAVTPDRCYTLAAFAEGAITDTDLSVFDADGEEIARDIRPERDAFVQLCPAAAGTLSVEVRARPGAGVVLLQPLAADAASVGGANTLWLGERLAWNASATPLPQALETARAALGAQGYAPAGAVSNLAFVAGESKETHVTLEPGRCTAVAAVAGRGLGRLSAALYDAAGELVARGQPRNGASVAVRCAPARETLTLRLRAEVGSGDAALAQFTGAAAPAWAARVDPLAVSEALGAQVALAQGPWRADGAPEALRVGARAVRTRELALAAGTCTRVAVSAGRGLPVLALTLRAPSGDVLAEGSADGTAIVTRCTRDGERVQLDVGIDPPGAAEYDAVLARFVRPDRAAGGR